MEGVAPARGEDRIKAVQGHVGPRSAGAECMSLEKREEKTGVTGGRRSSCFQAIFYRVCTSSVSEFFFARTHPARTPGPVRLHSGDSCGSCASRPHSLYICWRVF